MSVAVANAVLLTDGDAAFLRVNNRLPAHALPPGTVARATNCRFDEGKPGPRYGVAVDGWGKDHVELVPMGQNYSGGAYVVTGLVIGQEYYFTADTNGGDLSSIDYGGALAITDSGYFTADTTTVLLSGESSAPVTAQITKSFSALAYKRFSDPGTDTDNGVLITDEWRTTGDGGRGRAWRIYPGNVPVEIPLNGHDVWEGSRLIQCDNAMLLMRPGNERHYFLAADLDDPLNDRITLHCEPSWGIGSTAAYARRVKFEIAETDSSVTGANLAITDTDLTADTIAVATTGLVNGDAMIVTGLTGLAGVLKYINVVSSGVVSLYDTQANAIAGGATGKFNITVNDETGTLTERVPAPGNYYYALHVSSGIIELYSDATLQTKLLYSTLTAPVGKFYIELATDPAPFFGNGSPVLLMQPDGAGLNAFENGFLAAPVNVPVNNTVAASDLMTARNHRLTPGDSVTGTAFSGVTWPLFAAPQSEHTLRFYDTADHALADDGTTGLQALPDATGGFIWKTSASKMRMPPLREAIYYKGRVVGFNGFSNICIGDVGDFLHFEQFKGTVPANFGEAGRGIGFLELGDDALLIVKQHSVYVVAGLSGDSSGWVLEDVTKEFGGLSAAAMLNIGTDGWLFTRKGVASVLRTISGDKQATVDTVSDDIATDLKDVDWSRAWMSCAETWNGRYFLATPGRGQDDPVNNKLFVYNFRNQMLQLEQNDAAGEIVGRIVRGNRQAAWEGRWEGDMLTVYAFAKLMVNGEERLTFVTPDGLVCWLHDGWDDAGTAIESEILTRGYFGGREMLCLRGNLTWDTFNPKITASIVTRGVNEEETLAGIEALQYDNTKYLTSGQADYDPNTSTEEQFNAPHREDYSPADGDLAVSTLDVHQNLSEPFRCRVRGSAPQLRITNEQGSLRVCAVSLQGKPAGISATRKT